MYLVSTARDSSIRDGVAFANYDNAQQFFAEFGDVRFVAQGVASTLVYLHEFDLMPIGRIDKIRVVG